MFRFFRRRPQQPCDRVGLGAEQVVMLVCLGLVGVLGTFGMWPETAIAAESGRIQGNVEREGRGVADHRIMLIRFGPDQAVQRTPGQTDAQGHFVFDNLETGNQFEYVVGIRYEGQLYRSGAIKLESGQHRTGVLVEVGQGTAKAPAAGGAQPLLQITKHMMLVALQKDHLNVREVVTVRYTGSRPYTGPSAHTGLTPFSLYFPLPEGYYDLQDVQGLEAQHVRRHPSGLFYTAPLTPGEHRVVYTYALPFRENMTVVFVDRSLPTAALDVFVEDTHLVATSDLQFGGRVAAKPHEFLYFRGTDLAANSRSRLQLTRRTETMPLLQTGIYGLVLGIVLLGIAIPCYGAWRSRARQSQPKTITPAQLQDLYATRGRLLQTIASLDNRHEAGRLDEATYREQRQTYKAQLLDLVEQLYRTGNLDHPAPDHSTETIVTTQSRPVDAEQSERTS
jgi:hypothetical protein